MKNETIYNVIVKEIVWETALNDTIARVSLDNGRIKLYNKETYSFLLTSSKVIPKLGTFAKMVIT